MRYTTAGESHGKKLTVIVTGVPSGMKIDEGAINSDLRRRQGGYGRGGRQKIECDRAIVTSGIRFGKTIGSPISIDIENKDWENWSDAMAPFGAPPADLKREVTPRPGHADLVGVLKNDFDDCRNILERASARETAARVAAGAIAKEFLGFLGIEVFSWVNSIGQCFFDDHEIFDYTNDDFASDLQSKIEFSEMRCPDETATNKFIEVVESARKNATTCGGTFRVVTTGLICGLGGYATAEERLNSRLASSLFSIPAIKGVEFGLGFDSSKIDGRNLHDEIVLQGTTFTRMSNRAGGIEGGMSTGLPLIVTCAMKPIPTCMSPLRTVNLDTLAQEDSFKERSDVCAVPAAGVVGEAEVALVLADAYIKMFGSLCLGDIQNNIVSYKKRLEAMAK